MISCLSNRRMARPSLACHKRGFPASFSTHTTKMVQFGFQCTRTCKCGHTHTTIQSEVGGQSTHGQRMVAEKHSTICAYAEQNMHGSQPPVEQAKQRDLATQTFLTTLRPEIKKCRQKYHNVNQRTEIIFQ
jgi:hypothetical protein